MNISSLGALIKISLVVSAGATMVTPVAIINNKEISVFALNPSSEQLNQLSVSSAQTETPPLTEQQSKLPTSSDSLSPPNVIVATSSSERKEEDKKCFVIPAESSNGAKLLTCLKGPEIPRTGEELEEHENSYYLYDSVNKNQLSQIEGNIMWNPSNSQISIRLKKDDVKRFTTADGTFVTKGERWKEISDSEIDLLQECALYSKDFAGTTSTSSYVLVCGKDTEKISQENLEGIPLTLWESNN